jgi:O-antigen/teichoic acid export membrane protein
VNITSSVNRSNTRTVATNTFWYGFDSALGIGMAFATSIPLARVIGPERLGYFSYVLWLTSMSMTVGNLGIPGTAGKFMAEHIGRGESGIARAIYNTTMRMQAAAAVAITAIALVLVYTVGDVNHRLVSTILVLAILPAMLIAVPSQANLANESVRTNIPSSIASGLVYVAAVVISLLVGWDLIGVAGGFLLAKWIDFILRLVITNRWMREFAVTKVPRHVVRTMFRFAVQQMFMAIVVMLVWDKSDVILLKTLNSDIRQITFFAVVFNLVDKVVMFPQVLAGSLSTTLLAQYGRDQESVPVMAAASARYTFLFAAPMLFGLVLISSPLILVLYGSKYIEAIPVLALVAGFAVIRPLGFPADAIFRANARLGKMLFWATVCAIFNIVVDVLLIPHHGAIGAGIGNGTAQMLSLAGYWVVARRQFKTRLDFWSMTKIAVSALAMAPLAIICNAMLRPIEALMCDVIGGMFVFILMLRLTRVLQPLDVARLGHVREMLPHPMRLPVRFVLDFVSGEIA